MKPKTPRKETAGVRERPLDTFDDLKRGLNEWLRKNDTVFLRRSEDMQRRHRERAGQKNQTTI